MDPEAAPKFWPRNLQQTEGFLEAGAAVAPTSDDNHRAVLGRQAGSVGRAHNS